MVNGYQPATGLAGTHCIRSPSNRASNGNILRQRTHTLHSLLSNGTVLRKNVVQTKKKRKHRTIFDNHGIFPRIPARRNMGKHTHNIIHPTRRNTGRILLTRQENNQDDIIKYAF